MSIGRFQKILFLAVLLGVTAETAAQQKITASQKAFDEGLRLEKSSPQSAFKFFHQAATLVQDHEDVLFFKAVVKIATLGFSLQGDDEQVAFALFRRSIQSLAAIHPNERTTADLFYFGGVWYQNLATQPDSAILCFQRALTIWKGMSVELTEQVAFCYRSLGDVYKYSLYDYDAAEKYYEKSLEIREKIEPKNDYQLARVYFSLASTNRSQRDFGKALSYAFRTVELGIKLGDSEFLDATYSILGNIYRDMGQYDSARHLYQLAISSNKKSSKNRPNEMLAAFYQGLGEVLKMEGKYEDAISNYDRGLEIFYGMEVKSKNIFLHCLEQLGEIYAIIRQDARALDLYHRAIRLQTTSNLLKSGSAASLYRRMGDLFQKENYYDSALYYYQQSLISAVRTFNSTNFSDNPELDSVELNSFVYEALLGKADVLMKVFRRSNSRPYAQAALACYSLAERVLTEARNSLDMEEAKWAYLDANFELYERGIESVYELFQRTQIDSLLTTASYYFEASKSRSLAEAVQAAESYNANGISDPLLQERSNYKGSLFRLQDQLNKVTDETRVRAIRNSMVDIDRKMKLNESEIKRKYPSYFDTQVDHYVPLVGDIQKYTRNEGVVLLEYFWGNQFVYAMGISGKEVAFKRIGTVDSLVSLIKSLISSFQPEQTSADLKAYQLFTHCAFRLHQLLLEPFRILTNGQERIIVVPDGMIGQIPFEVLISEQAKRTSVDYKTLHYIIKEKVIGYTFSAAMLLRQKSAVVADPKLLAFGLTGRQSLRSGQDMTGESGGAALELASLSRQFPSGQFYLGDRATKEGFMQNAAGFDLIHLAIHGRGNTEMNYSASLFFKNRSDSTNEGELHWYELYGMKLKANLAVLSSCESGLGKSYKGEGMLSMASAFVNAGCNNTVMGLWKVNDQVSIDLMEIFYDGLLNGMRIDESLAVAKRDYLDRADEFSADPKMWGALVAYGNDRVVQKEKGKWIFISIALFLLVIAAAIIYVRKLWPLGSRRLDVSVRGRSKQNIS